MNISEEELLSLLNNSESPTSNIVSLKDDVKYVWPDELKDVLSFVSFFDLTKGSMFVDSQFLYHMYMVWKDGKPAVFDRKFYSVLCHLFKKHTDDSRSTRGFLIEPNKKIDYSLSNRLKIYSEIRRAKGYKLRKYNVKKAKKK